MSFYERRTWWKRQPLSTIRQAPNIMSSWCPENVALYNVLKRPIHVYKLTQDTETYPTEKERLQNPGFRLRRMTCFGSPKFDRKEPLHILSADSRFPDVSPGRHLASDNHFLVMFPTHVKKRRRRKRKKHFSRTWIFVLRHVVLNQREKFSYNLTWNLFLLHSSLFYHLLKLNVCAIHFLHPLNIHAWQK